MQGLAPAVTEATRRKDEIPDAVVRLPRAPIRPPLAGGATSPPDQDGGAIDTRRRHSPTGRAHEYWVKSPQHAARDSVPCAARGLKAVGSAHPTLTNVSWGGQWLN